ncbi:MAG: tRNA (guanosine(46)-N7)-methyltransferase TrmB [Helicobacteraceae bacterium]|jgi:tRNA (guanine-N7-)-methyltransferase|nr:tRNA (guanosine(46)-N7)-methyltransferase TrmB [Helicobacteraceae bacterium]
MPHLIVKDFAAAKTPFEKDGATFLFASIEEEGVVGVQIGEIKFLLRFCADENRTILKVDKATRPPFLEAIKRALISFAQASGATILHKNFDRIGALRDRRNFYEPIEFLASYDQKTPLWIETGFGSGRHILQNAKSFADKLHLGVEIHRPSAERLLKRAEAENLTNIAVVVCDAKALFAALPSLCAQRIFIHFPVPWNKSPKRRVFNQSFLGEALRVLTANGVLNFRSDDRIYFDDALTIAREFKQVSIEIKQNAEAITRSKYEDRWRNMNKTIFDLFLTKERSQTREDFAYDFSFPSGDLSQKDLPYGLIAISEGFLLRATERWRLANKGLIVRLIMGDLLALETLYLLIEDERASYFPSAPLPTRQNYAAHRALIEALYA